MRLQAAPPRRSRIPSSALLAGALVGLVLLDGLLVVGLFSLLEAMGLNEVPLDPTLLPGGEGLGALRDGETVTEA